MSGEEEDGELLCACRFVTVARIDELLAEGRTRLFQIQNLTGAGRGCGTCKDRLVAHLIRRKEERQGGSRRREEP